MKQKKKKREIGQKNIKFRNKREIKYKKNLTLFGSREKKLYEYSYIN